MRPRFPRSSLLALVGLALGGGPGCEPMGVPIGPGARSESGGTPSAGGASPGGGAGGEAGTSPMRCPTPSFANAVAHWSFDEDLSAGRVRDLARGHDGVLHGSGWSLVPGRDGCGQALHFAGGSGAGAYIEVPDSPDFDLSVGSIGFQLWVGQCDQGVEFGGLVSRDATGTSAGHLQVRLSDRCATRGVITGSEPNCGSITEDFGCHVTVRLQSADESYYVTSPEPLPLEQWVHVGVSFGDAVELYLEGALVGAVPAPGIGLAGNDEALLLGASNSNSQVGRWLRDASLDEVHVSSLARDFTR